MRRSSSRITRQEEVYESLLESARDGSGVITDTNGYSRCGLLRFLLTHKDVLLHGSNRLDLQELAPRKANCIVKADGNRNAVYAVNDEMLAIFYAIRKKTSASGIVTASLRCDGQKRQYLFEMSSSLLLGHPWTTGCVYIVPKEAFQQCRDDTGTVINEWMTDSVVVPIARLVVRPSDFSFLDKITPL